MAPWRRNTTPSATVGAGEKAAQTGTEIVIKIGEYEVEEWIKK